MFTRAHLGAHDRFKSAIKPPTSALERVIGNSPTLVAMREVGRWYSGVSRGC